MAAMGKIKAENIHARFNQFQQFIVAVTGRPHGCHDLGAVVNVRKTCFFIHVPVQVLIKIFRHRIFFIISIAGSEIKLAGKDLNDLEPVF
jgi:hypothetical protein